MALANPELFANGTCGRPLPAGELLQEFRFGQFCPLKLVDHVGEAALILGEQRESGEGGTPGKPGHQPGSLRTAGTMSLAGRDRVSFADLLQSGPSTAVTGGARSAALRPTMAVAGGGLASLIDEQKDTTGGNGRTDTGDRTIRASHTVKAEDLTAWLAAPWAVSNGIRIKFPVTADQAGELVRSGEVTLRYDNYLVTIHLEKAAAPAGGTGTGTGTGVTAVAIGIALGKAEYTPGSEKKEQKTYTPSRLFRPPDDGGVLLAVYFEWKQSWTLKGFSRGRLLQSLALAPQEETTIELFTWDRRKKTLEQSSSTETEMSSEEEEKTQDSTEVFRELTKKEEFELKAGGSLDVQYNPGAVKIKLDAEVKGGEKTNADNVARTTTKAIQDGLHKSAARVKAQRASKVTETAETGSEQRITRKVRNPNLCHTLNLDYFEILTHYTIVTEFNKAGIRFCAMIGNPIAERKYPAPFIRQHEGPLRDALLDRSLAPGFDGLRLLRAREVAMKAIDDRRERREKDPLPAPPADTGTSQTGLSDEEIAANGYLVTLQATAAKIMDTGNAANLENALTCLGGNVDALGTKKGQVLARDLDGGKRWLAQQLLLRSYSQLTLTLADLAQDTKTPQIREWGPRLASVMPDPASMPNPSQLNQQPQEVKQGLLSPMMWGPHGPYHVKQAADWGWWWAEIQRVGLLEAEDAGLGTQLEQFPKVYRAFLDAVKSKSGDADQRKLLDQQMNNQARQSDEDRLENDFPIRDYALAQERAEVLQAHLQEHAEHYSFALFLALPPQEQLDHIEAAMASITTGFQPGFFQPRVVSQIGSKLLVPLNHEVIDGAQDYLDVLREEIRVATEEDSVMLPSPGLTIDARLGRCSGCEDFIEDSRLRDLELRAAQVRQAVAEAKRLEDRLVANPPQLDDPHAPVPRVSVELQKPAQA